MSLTCQADSGKTEPGTTPDPTRRANRPLDASGRVRASGRRLVAMVQDLLDRGVEEGVFRPGIDPVQLNITLAAIGYYYLTNRFTGAVLFQRDFMSKDALDDRLAFNINTIMRLVEA